MDTSKPLVNKVAQSGLITIDLEQFFPAEEIVVFDLKPFLFQGLILKEKSFRTAMKEVDWPSFTGKILASYCSSDAIIPVWAYMLIASYATPHAQKVFQGSKTAFLTHHYETVIGQLDLSKFEDQRLVIKGCSDRPVPPSAYSAITARLRPIARSIMYGEPCSTVPIFKRKNK